MTTNDETNELEETLRDTFSRFADSGPIESVPGTIEVTDVHHRSNRWSSARMGVLAAAAAVILAVTTGVVLDRGSSDGSPASHVSAGAGANAPAQASSAAAPTDAGPEVGLVTANTSDTKDVISIQSRQGKVDTSPVVVAAGNAAPVVASPGLGCITIAFAGPGGYQGACIDASRQTSTLVATNAEGASMGVKSTWYVAWLGVPAGTSYVVFSYGTEKSWMRPVNGVSYMTVVATGTEPIESRPVARAFDNKGNQIAEARLLG